MPTRAEVKAWRSLHRGKGRRDTGCFLAEGPRLVGELLDWPGRTVAVLYADAAPAAPGLRDLLGRAAGRGVRTEAVPEALISALADATTPQPVIAIGEVPVSGWDDVGPGTIVLLDGVQDPGNVGTLVRTAVALGIAGVVGVGDTADPWGPKALRASAGAVLRGPVFRTDAPDAVARLAERGVSIWAAAADGPPMDRAPHEPVALALGSEAHGLSGTLLAAARRRVAVPLAPGVESLNVAAAGAILLDRLRSGNRGG
ncbi:TrmH family RNA methyltransferase [Candidatus Palauibacter sp.]|uniref:TrmH family RNA methyltransferase n=1 Tax=Candidatus Palauibacter sp. TaxID=3101350 RepID=UPI003B5ADC70